MTTALNTEPLFSPEAQEVFTPGDRVYLISDTTNLNEGTEGTYLGRLSHEAIVDWDTPSGEPYRSGVPFEAVRQLYR